MPAHLTLSGSRAPYVLNAETTDRYRLVMESGATRSNDLAARLLAGCDPQQREAITTDARPLCVLAAAGSGKTRVLTRRIAWRVNEGTASARYVLALTFTRKAASELRGRLASLGLERAGDGWDLPCGGARGAQAPGSRT